MAQTCRKPIAPVCTLIDRSANKRRWLNLFQDNAGANGRRFTAMRSNISGDSGEVLKLHGKMHYFFACKRGTLWSKYFSEGVH